MNAELNEYGHAGYFNHEVPNIDGPTKVYSIPHRFFDDHTERELPAGRVVSITKRHLRVEMDRALYDELLDDADYYSDADAFGDWDSMPLVSSARATKAALLKAGPPDA